MSAMESYSTGGTIYKDPELFFMSLFGGGSVCHLIDKDQKGAVLCPGIQD